MARWNGGFASVWGLGDNSVGSRKEGKAKRSSASKEVLLGCCIRLGPGSLELRVYLGIERLRRDKPISKNFRIKPFYPKIGGMCLHQNLGKERENSQASKIVPIKESIEWGSMSADSDTTLESDLLGWCHRIAMMNYGWYQETTYRTLQKGKDYSPSYLKLGIFSFMSKIVISHA